MSTQASALPVATTTTSQSQSDSTTKATAQIAAVKQSGGHRDKKKQKGGREKGQSQGRATRHSDNPPENACGMHWKWGRQAYFCKDTANCPLANFVSTRPKKE